MYLFISLCQLGGVALTLTVPWTSPASTARASTRAASALPAAPTRSARWFCTGRAASARSATSADLMSVVVPAVSATVRRPRPSPKWLDPAGVNATPSARWTTSATPTQVPATTPAPASPASLTRSAW